MNSLKSGFTWKLLERFGVLGMQFVLQIILARILDPAHYGALSIMVVFTALANVFIQQGFNTALVRTKDVAEEDYSSVLWVSLAVAVVLYLIIFFTAPLIASFYKVPYIVNPLRVLALMVIPGALNSVQIAKVQRELDFKKVFVSNLCGVLLSGIVSILVALLGGGLWSLVVQSLLNVVTVCIVMRFTVSLKIRLVCSIKRIKILFSFGWKLLVSGLIDTLYQDLRSLVIGGKYDESTLGYYNRGKQFPQFLNNAVNGAVQSVMLSAMSKEQDDIVKVKSFMRTSISLSAYVVFPVMAGLAAIAEPLIRVLLTDKWLPCVPYLRVYCFTFAFYPVHSCNLQTINALGRSDVFLTLEIIKKTYGILALVVAVLCFDSPLAIAMTGIITTVISCFVNAYPNKKLIGYSYSEQFRDILPSLLASMTMCAMVLLVGTLGFSPLITLIVQIFAGIVFYLIISMIFKIKSYNQIVTILKSVLMKRKSD